MTTLRTVTGACLMFVLALGARADIQIYGDRLTIGSNNLQLAFKGGDLVTVRNKLTGETFVRTTSVQQRVLDMGMINPPDKPTINFGWRQGKAEANPETAQIQFNDQTRSVWMNVGVDPETDDITVTLWGEANREGVTGLTWGLRGLDLTSGKLILPVLGGRYVDASVSMQGFSYAYPGDWEAQVAIWQAKQGGFVVYSRDKEARYKRISMVRTGAYADVLLETEAQGPFEKAGGVPAVEWRFNAYRGDWKVPATGYRNVMRFFRPPAAVPKERAWVKDIRTVTTIRGPHPDPKLPETLSKQLDAQKTLLYLPDWRRAGFGLRYPDYDWYDGLREFIERAHDFGFRVMLHTDLRAVSPSHPEYQRLKNYQVADPRTGRPMGFRWDQPASDPRRIAFINPASETWRTVLLSKLKSVISELGPDALFLSGTGTLMNDGNSGLTHRNFAEGCMALQRAILTAYPRLALGVDGINELTAPYSWFAARSAKTGLPPHPISAYLFGDINLSFPHPDLPQPDTTPVAWADAMAVLEGQGIPPSPVAGPRAELTAVGAGAKLTMDIARSWQSHDFAPFWQADWNGSRFAWRGSDGGVAGIVAHPWGSQWRVGEETVFRRIGGVSSVTTTDRIPGWPGYDDKVIHGLSAARSYPAAEGPRSKQAIRIPVLSPGAVIEWAQFTEGFALFGFAPARAAAAAPIHFEIALPDGLKLAGVGGSAGIPREAVGGSPAASADAAASNRLIFAEAPAASWVALFYKIPRPSIPGQDLAEAPRDDAMASGGIVTPADPQKPEPAVCAETPRPKSLDSSPPAGGSRVHSWAVMLPDQGPMALSFQAGLTDGSGGEGVEMEARVNGETVWRASLTNPKWELGQADLSRWAGKPVIIQLISRSKGDIGGDKAVWSEIFVK